MIKNKIKAKIQGLKLSRLVQYALLSCYVISSDHYSWCVEAFGVPAKRKSNSDRRTFISDNLIKVVATTTGISTLPIMDTTVANANDLEIPATSLDQTFNVFQVLPDASDALSPSIKPVAVRTETNAPIFLVRTIS